MAAETFKYSGNVYTAGIAGSTDFALVSTEGIPIGYLENAHIHVYRSTDDGALWVEQSRPSAWDFTSGGAAVRLVTPLASGEWVKVQRITPSESPYVSFQGSSQLTAEQLNDSTLYNSFLNQEQEDRANATADIATTATATSTAAALSASQAVATAGAAEAKAESAAAAIGSFGVFRPVNTVADIPASPVDGEAIQVTDSTGIELFTPLANLPNGFVGDPGIYARIQYSTALQTWSWFGYVPADPDSRYLRDAIAARLDQAQTFTAEQTFTELKETVHTLPTSGVISLDPANGSLQSCQMTNNIQLVDALENGQSVLLSIQNASLFIVQWPTTTWVSQGGNAAPSLTAKDVVSFWKAGGVLYGNLVGSFA